MGRYYDDEIYQYFCIRLSSHLFGIFAQYTRIDIM